MIDISLIIPTHNRARSLERTLHSALGQDIGSPRYEVIIVDNASTDDTAGVVGRLQEGFAQCKLRYVSESRIGLQEARHAGAHAAAGQVLVFTDDDATFDPKWLRAYTEAFAEHPDMVAAGGPVKPVWEKPRPEWLENFMSANAVFPIFSLMERGREFQLTSSAVFYGVNMAIRRRVLFATGGFNPEAVGDTWLGDGEAGLNRKLSNRGLLVGYVPEALVYHHIPSRRMTVEYMCRRVANEGACDVYARFRNRVVGRRELLQYAGSTVARHGGTWLRSILLNGREDPRSLSIQLEAARTRSRLKYALRLVADRKLKTMVRRDRWL